MKISQVMFASAALASLASWPVIGAIAPPKAVQVIRGAAHTEKGADRNGDWLVANDAEATVRTTNGTFRLTKGAAVRVREKSNVVDTRGRVFCKVASQEWLRLNTGKRYVTAKDGEFVLDSANGGQMRVFDGEVFAEREQRPIFRTAAVDWTDEPVALDGPDVRKRNKNRRRFTQGEENKGKRIGEDEPPAQTASPAYTPSPSPTFSPQASVTPTITPTTPPSPTNPPPAAEAGGWDPWPLVGGLAGAGGLTAFLLTRDDGDASP